MALGIPRTELMARMPASEFFEWMILEQIEPFGEKAEYLRAGTIAAAVANWSALRDPKADAILPSDFFKPIEEPQQQQKQQTPEQMAALMNMFKGIQDEFVRQEGRRILKPR